MAALVEGQQYGLSAQDKINCTKSLVFVKLTDSAYRAIEEYIKNKGDAISRPTIQFQNSNGVISLPQNGSSQHYGFTLSNVEADGPHGSFECLRQTGYRSLESLGCLQVKMHIHANEDSYENTRVKMAAVEKEQKKSCTKVIKPAGAHLGRKVKVKRPGLVVSPMKSSPPTASMVSKPPMKTHYAPPPRSPEAKINNPPVKRPDIPKPNPPKKNPELMRQPIRDRIIHILAVRPYKRPELLVRLNHEGVREKDKNKLTSILPQLSVLKGNIYYLANYLWNEVQDNWKFCTQEELEIIRKRKQQHLSSSTENETPPPSSQPNTSPAQKRLSSEVTSNGNPRSKKQRISHYKGDPQRNPFGGTSELSNSTFSRKSPFSPGRAPFASSAHEDESDSYQSSSRFPTDSVLPNYLSPNLHSRTREDMPRIPREDEKSSRLSPNMKRDDDKSSRISPDFNPRVREERGSGLSPNIRRDDDKTSRLSPSMKRDDDKSSRLSPTMKREDNKSSRLSPTMKREDNKSSRLSPTMKWESDKSSRLSPSMRQEDEKSYRLSPPNGVIKPYSNGINRLSPNVNHRVREDYPRTREDRSRMSPPLGRDKLPSTARKEGRSIPIGVAQKFCVNSNDTNGKASQILSHPRPVADPVPQVSPDSNTPQFQKEAACSKTSSNGYVNSINQNGYTGSQPSYVNNRTKVTSTTNGSCSNSPHSSCDSMEYNDAMQDIQLLPPGKDSPERCNSPEYEKEYGRIVSNEQRMVYKEHFNAEYQEYLRLHETIISISNKFVTLRLRLETCRQGSEEHKEIRNKIVKDYRAYQQDPDYIETLSKFNFLHNKLAHIKRLVAEFDNARVRS